MLALDQVQRGSVQFLTFISQYICHATLAGRKAGRLSMNTAQSVDRLSTNKAYHLKMTKYVLLFEIWRDIFQYLKFNKTSFNIWNITRYVSKFKIQQDMFQCLKYKKICFNIWNVTRYVSILEEKNHDMFQYFKYNKICFNI